MWRVLALTGGLLTLVIGSLSAGLWLEYAHPEIARPAVQTVYQSLVGPGRVILGLPQRLFGQTNIEAMNRDDFAVQSGGLNDGGTIVFAMRGAVEGSGYRDRVVEVKRDGSIVFEFYLPTNLFLMGDARKLDDGTYAFLLAEERPQVALFDPSVKKWLMTVDRDGRELGRIQVEATHEAEPLPNGNWLLVDASRDRVSEVTKKGDLVWHWDAADHIQPYTPTTFKGLPQTDADRRNIVNMYREFGEGFAKTDWTHVNSAQRLSNGHTIISLRNFDVVIEVDQDGTIVRSFGSFLLKHQHCAWMLDDSRLLVTDNGNGRVAEFDLRTQAVLWQYSGLILPQQGCAYRLPSGNTLITESGRLRVLEVTPAGNVVWQLTVKTPGTVPLYRATWHAD